MKRSYEASVYRSATSSRFIGLLYGGPLVEVLYCPVKHALKQYRIELFPQIAKFNRSAELLFRMIFPNL